MGNLVDSRQEMMGNKAISIANCIFNSVESKTILQIGSCFESNHIVNQFLQYGGCSKENIIKTDNQNNISTGQDCDLIPYIEVADIIIISATTSGDFIRSINFESILKKGGKCHMLIINVSINIDIDRRLNPIKDIFYFHFLHLN